MTDPNYNGTIDDVVLDDPKTVRRYITGVPSGDGLAIAFLTIRKSLSPAGTDDTTALAHLRITSVSGTAGQIEVSGSADGTAILRFDLAPEHLSSQVYSPDRTYFYDIRGVTASGVRGRPEIGTFRPKLGATFSFT